MKFFNSDEAGRCPVTTLSDTFLLSNEQLEGIFKDARAESPVNRLPFWPID